MEVILEVFEEDMDLEMFEEDFDAKFASAITVASNSAKMAFRLAQPDNLNLTYFTYTRLKSLSMHIVR